MNAREVNMRKKKISRKKILIIDDDPDIVKTTKGSLECEGYKVNTAYSGEEGLEKIKEDKPDLILLDLVLPGWSGSRTAREIRSRDEYKDIPIIVLSCKTEYLDKYVAVKSGAVAYIEKPYDMDRLFFCIRDILGS